MYVALRVTLAILRALGSRRARVYVSEGAKLGATTHVNHNYNLDILWPRSQFRRVWKKIPPSLRNFSLIRRETAVVLLKRANSAS